MSDTTRVLLVEDAPGDARLVEELLAEEAPGAFQVRWVRDLAAARQALGDAATDVVLLDMGLPDGEGLELLGVLRAEAGQTPIVVLTGRDDEQLALEALRQGAQDYLRKADLRGTCWRGRCVTPSSEAGWKPSWPGPWRRRSRPSRRRGASWLA